MRIGHGFSANRHFLLRSGRVRSSPLTVDSTPLTFTTGNWSTPQTVTLTAFDDSNRTDGSFTLTHTASGGGYGSVTASLSVTVEDDDGPVQAHIDSGGIVSLTEGGSRTYRIWLDSAPTEQVTVAVTAPSKVSVNPMSLTFTTGNWSTPQTVTLEALHDTDTSDETQYVTHRATKGDYTTTLSRVQVEITDDDDGEDQIGSRPSAAVWWAALTARRETGGATGHIDYTSPHADTGKLSSDSFTYGGVTRAIDGLFVDRNGHFQIWVHSGNGSVLPNGSVLHVGSESLTLGSATRQSFRTMYNDGKTPIMREHAYWWQSGSHGVSLSDRQVVAVWLEVPAGSELPGVPRSVNAQARDGKASLEWGAPPEVAHLVLVEPRHLRPGDALPLGIDNHHVRIVPGPGDRRQPPMQGFEHRLPDAHQRQDSDKGRNLPAFLRVHDGIQLPLSRIHRNAVAAPPAPLPPKTSFASFPVVAAGRSRPAVSIPAPRLATTAPRRASRSLPPIPTQPAREYRVAVPLHCDHHPGEAPDATGRRPGAPRLFAPTSRGSERAISACDAIAPEHLPIARRSTPRPRGAGRRQCPASAGRIPGPRSGLSHHRRGDRPMSSRIAEIRVPPECREMIQAGALVAVSHYRER